MARRSLNWIIVDEMERERSTCMDCMFFSDGVTDFPYCKLNKIASFNCYDYIPRGIAVPTIGRPIVTRVMEWKRGVDA